MLGGWAVDAVSKVLESRSRTGVFNFMCSIALSRSRVVMSNSLISSQFVFKVKYKKLDLNFEF